MAGTGLAKIGKQLLCGRILVVDMAGQIHLNHRIGIQFRKRRSLFDAVFSQE